MGFLLRLLLFGFINTLIALGSTFLLCKWLVGWHLQRSTSARRELILARIDIEEQDYQSKLRHSARSDDGDWEKIESYATGSAPNGGKSQEDWKGVVGFFHPFCNAGGGGERVLWAAIKATQKRWPKAVCVVYTGDNDVTKSAILERVKNNFNIQLYPPTVVFLYLQTRYYVLPTTYPHFTLLGQSLGSLILAYEAFSMLVPDIFIDTMGYSFTLALCKFFFIQIPTGAYVHYPTISTDMLESLDAEMDKGLNTGAGKGFRGTVKKSYWKLFAWMYSWVGGNIDVVMTNSSWTQAHIESLWGPNRRKRQNTSGVEVVFPPCAVEEIEQAVQVTKSSEAERKRILVYIAQFRPEKKHEKVINAFSKLLRSQPTEATKGAKLLLIGSVREDDKKRVVQLKTLPKELHIENSVEFLLNAKWPVVLQCLQQCSVGVNVMWNEHFGIGVVEYQAAGLISVVDDSGGPKADIVVDYNGGPTGFHATTEAQFADRFLQALSMSSEETLAMRLRARASAKRFTEEAFAKRWVVQMGELIALQRSKSS